MRNAAYLLFVLGITCCSFHEASAEQPPGSQQAAQLDVKVPVKLNYLLYLPKDYEQKESFPLMLFLHGAGERGDDLELVKIWGPPKLIAEGKDFPFIVASPQCPKGRWWEPIELVALIDHISAHYKVDPDRVVVTGLSMGGFGSWSLAAYAPDRLAAIAPICGGGNTYWADRFTKIPVWAFHGAMDKAVPLQKSEEMVTAITKRGGNAKLTVYPDAGHNSWSATYANPELYEWLLQQRRQPATDATTKEK